MTDGTAVGSTDQRYFCKDCDYHGSLVFDDDLGGDNKKVLEDLEKIKKELPKAKDSEIMSKRTSSILFYLVMFPILLALIALIYSAAFGFSDKSAIMALGTSAIILSFTYLFYRK